MGLVPALTNTHSMRQTHEAEMATIGSIMPEGVQTIHEHQFSRVIGGSLMEFTQKFDFDAVVVCFRL